MVFEKYSERSGSVINFNLLSYLIVQPPHPYKYQMIREKKPDGASALTGCIVQIGALAYVIDFTPQIRIVLYYLPKQSVYFQQSSSKIWTKKNLCDKNSISYTAAKDLKEIVRDCIGSQKKLLVYQNCLRQFSPTGFFPFLNIFLLS